MARTLLSLLLLCFASLHVAPPSATVREAPIKLILALGYDAADTDDNASPAFSEIAAECHHGCSWLAEWDVPEIREVGRSAFDRLASSTPPGIATLVAPPPK
jgi:hypothetical protein